MPHKLQTSLDMLTRMAKELELIETELAFTLRHLQRNGVKGRAPLSIEIALKYAALTRARIIDARIAAEPQLPLIEVLPLKGK